MIRLKKWLAQNELFADFSLAISIIVVVALIPFENDYVVPILICAWLFITTVKGLKDNKSDDD